MSYYQQNLYGNYPYNQYGQFSNSFIQPQQQNNYQMLQGKIVDNIETAKVTDIPFGGYGVFPKADMSEIYIKTWTNNGTTSITVYKPNKEEEKKEENNITELILSKMQVLEEKIDNISNLNGTTKTKTNQTSTRKEINTNVY